MRIRRPRWLGAALGLTLAAGTAACTSAPADPTATSATSAATTVASGAPTSGTGGAGSLAPAAVSAWWRSRAACPVDLPADVAATELAPGGDRAIWPQGGASADGWLAVTEYSPGFAGVALWNIGTKERREVYRFANPQASAMGAFDGRYLVSKEVASSANWNVFTLRAYDLQTGQTWTLDTDPGPDVTGQVPATPLESFGVRDGRAWWIRATAANVMAVKLADLGARTTTQLAQGDYVTAQFYGDDLLVEHFGQDRYGVRELLDATGAVKPLPARLARFNGNRWLAVGPRRDLAWLNDDWTELSYAGPEDDTGRVVMRMSMRSKFQNLPVLDESGLVVPTMEPGTYYLDTTTGAYSKVLAGNFGTLLGHRVVTLPAAEAAKPKTTGGYGVLRVLDLPSGALACPS